MNITSINSNQATFTARKIVSSKGKYAKETKNTLVKAAATLGIGGTLASAGIYGLVQANMDSRNKAQEAFPTTPTSIVADYEIETQPLETEAAIDLNAYYESMAIPVKPRNEWISIPEHNISQDDRLTDIVISNARLDENTQYKDLIPYIERLMLDNPYLIKRVIRYDVNGNLALPEYTLIYNKQQPGKLNVDSIFPENRLEKEDIIEETLPIETEETEPIQETSEEDTVTLNDVEFYFDKGTLKKGIFGKYEGLMFNRYSVLNIKTNGNTVLKEYEGQTSDSNVAKIVTRDEEGKIIEYEKYENGKLQSISTYEYTPDTTIETVVDKTATNGQPNKIITIYDRTEDYIYSKAFYANGDLVATFDFENNQVQIGKNESITFDFVQLLEMIG